MLAESKSKKFKKNFTFIQKCGIIILNKLMRLEKFQLYLLKKNFTFNQNRVIISSMKTIMLNSNMHKQLPQAGWNCSRPEFTVEGDGYAISDSGGFGKQM